MTSALLHQLLRLQVRLLACRARLQASSDGEALHDLRIALRRLRSLLRPLRGLPLLAQLDAAVAALAQRSSGLRDLQVLIAELRGQGLVLAADHRQSLCDSGIQELAGCAELQQLLLLLDALPQFWRLARREGCLRQLDRRLRRQLAKQRRQLQQALDDPACDWHRLRLLIKRLRYAAEAYPQQSALSVGQLRLLRQAQALLGDWHDRLLWLLQEQQADDLAACRERWQAEQAGLAAQAEVLLQRLSRS